MKNSKTLAELTDLKAVENLEQVKGGIFFHLLYAKKSFFYGGYGFGGHNNYGGFGKDNGKDYGKSNKGGKKGY